MSIKGFNQKDWMLKRSIQKNNRFHKNLINAKIFANIPIHKLENAEFKRFLEECTAKNYFPYLL